MNRSEPQPPRDAPSQRRPRIGLLALVALALTATVGAGVLFAQAFDPFGHVTFDHAITVAVVAAGLWVGVVGVGMRRKV